MQLDELDGAAQASAKMMLAIGEMIEAQGVRLGEEWHRFTIYVKRAPNGEFVFDGGRLAAVERDEPDLPPTGRTRWTSRS